MSSSPQMTTSAVRKKMFVEVQGYLHELDVVRPLVEGDRIEEFARLYTQAYMAKMRLMR